MKADLGSIGVTAAFAASLLGCLFLVFGLIRNKPVIVASGHRFVPIVIGGAVVAVGAMQWALISHDYSLTYVAANNARSTPLLYTVAGMWAALEGSILLWGVILAGLTFAVFRKYRARRTDPLVGWATAVLLGTCTFFFALMVGPANPFTQLVIAPADGRGPNPLLANHPLMAIHPPILYLGYVGFTVPFAFAIAAMATGRLGEGWLVETRRWTLIAWGALTIGIGLGAWWSYEVLGWGGYWGWDAVENASFLPWLTGTAYVHSVMVQERRGLLRVWNLSLLCATFCLTILGTFLTRSGVISSVHAFSNSQIGPWILTFFGICVALTLGLIFWRGDSLRSTGTIDSPLSREGAFLANNVVFAAFAFVVLLGTIFPLLVEAWNGERLSVGAPYFDTLTAPIGLVLLFLMAIAPVLPWRKASTELLSHRLQWPVVFGVVVTVASVIGGLRGMSTLLAFFLGAFASGSAVRQLVLATRAARARGDSRLRGILGRANGGMVVHLGVIMIAVAIASSQAYSSNTELVLKPGQTKTFKGHTVELVRIRTEFADVKRTGGISGDTDPQTVVSKIAADVRIDGGRIDSPAITRFAERGQAVPTPSVRTGLVRDLYVTLVQQPSPDGGTAIIGFYIQPMIVWLWIGLGLMGVGTILALFPGRRRRATSPSSVPDGSHEALSTPHPAGAST
jgi:cytochrome c-type biogenesis protein CcmF